MAQEASTCELISEFKRKLEWLFLRARQDASTCEQENRNNLRTFFLTAWQAGMAHPHRHPKQSLLHVPGIRTSQQNSGLLQNAFRDQSCPRASAHMLGKMPGGVQVSPRLSAPPLPAQNAERNTQRSERKNPLAAQPCFETR